MSDLAKIETEKEDFKVSEISFPILDEILGRLSGPLSHLMKSNEQEIKDWYVGLYRGQNRDLLSLVETNEDGSRNISKVIEHMVFLDTVLNVIKTRKQVAEYIRIDFLNKATDAEREALREEDKKYRPTKQVETKKIPGQKLTDNERKILKLMDMKFSREDAEKLILGKECETCKRRICTCEKKQ